MNFSYTPLQQNAERKASDPGASLLTIILPYFPFRFNIFQSLKYISSKIYVLLRVDSFSVEKLVTAESSSGKPMDFSPSDSYTLPVVRSFFLENLLPLPRRILLRFRNCILPGEVEKEEGEDTESPGKNSTFSVSGRKKGKGEEKILMPFSVLQLCIAIDILKTLAARVRTFSEDSAGRALNYTSQTAERAHYFFENSAERTPRFPKTRAGRAPTLARLVNEETKFHRQTYRPTGGSSICFKNWECEHTAGAWEHRLLSRVVLTGRAPNISKIPAGRAPALSQNVHKVKQQSAGRAPTLSRRKSSERLLRYLSKNQAVRPTNYNSETSAGRAPLLARNELYMNYCPRKRGRTSKLSRNLRLKSTQNYSIERNENGQNPVEVVTEFAERIGSLHGRFVGQVKQFGSKQGGRKGKPSARTGRKVKNQSTVPSPGAWVKNQRKDSGLSTQDCTTRRLGCRILPEL